MALLALGIMSGTSADGVSLALVSISKSDLKVLAHTTYPYPDSLRKKILQAAELPGHELSRLNFELGHVFAGAALRFLKKEKVPSKRLFVIGSHGQTVCHGPEDNPPHTLQIGEPAVLAEKLRVPVAADFRPQDVAAEGQGAPLIPFLDHFLFGSGPLRALQNIGGIANAAVVGKGIDPIALDTGPGNCLLDLAVRQGTRKLRMDKDGKLAGQGRIHESLVRGMLNFPYFRKSPPKSADRSLFGEKFLAKYAGKLSLKDRLATLTFFTARSIKDSYERFIFPKYPVQEIIVSGGGAFNPVLMEHLKRLFHPIPVQSIEKYGIPILAKEPACFALMAHHALKKIPNHIPSATGAKRPLILGKILS